MVQRSNVTEFGNNVTENGNTSENMALLRDKIQANDEIWTRDLSLTRRML